MSSRRPFRFNLDDPGHQAVRSGLRVLGPMVFLTGLCLLIVGAVSFFQSFASFGVGQSSFPRYFWCAFLGLPLMWLGGVLSVPAYMATASRFMAREMIPVQRDAFNTMADGASDGIRTVAQAIGEGFAAAGGYGGTMASYCSACGAGLPEHARFCPGCGKALGGPQPVTTPRA